MCRVNQITGNTAFVKRLSYDDLFELYVAKYNGNPKYDYVHFITTIAKIDLHRTIIRPMLEWYAK